MTAAIDFPVYEGIAEALGIEIRWRPKTSHGRAWDTLSDMDRDEIRAQCPGVKDAFLSVAKWERIQ